MKIMRTLCLVTVLALASVSAFAGQTDSPPGAAPAPASSSASSFAAVVGAVVAILAAR